MFDIDLSSSVLNFDIELSQSSSSTTRFNVKLSSVFGPYPTLIKLAGVFVEKQNYVKIGGTFS
jgi:hypothetical protein